MVILQVQIELKGTPCLDKYKEQEKKIQLANKAKEMLLLTATAKSADDSGDVLDDDNDVANLLPDSMNDLNKLMQSAIIAHEKAKNTTSDKPVKGKGGASKSSRKRRKRREPMVVAPQPNKQIKTPTRTKRNPLVRINRRAAQPHRNQTQEGENDEEEPPLQATIPTPPNQAARDRSPSREASP